MNNVGINKIAVFSECYSHNLGDGVIFDSISFLLSNFGIEAVPIDLSGRESCSASMVQEIDASLFTFVRNVMRVPIRRYGTLRKLCSTSKWYLYDMQKTHDRWSHIIKSVDAVIIGGGQLLTDIDFGFPPKIFKVAKLAQYYKKPLCILGCGVGSTGWSLVARNIYDYVLRRAEYISVRDEDSLNMIRNRLPSSVKVNLHPDVAFMINQFQNYSLNLSDNKVVGFNFQPLLNFKKFLPSFNSLSNDTYLNLWVRLIQGACVAGYRPVIVTNGHPLDYETARSVVDRLNASGFQVVLADRPLSSEALIRQLADLPNLLCTRMHAGIISYCLGNKVIPISWDPKVVGVWSNVGLEDLVVSAEDLFIREWNYFENIFDNFVHSPKILECAQKKILSAMSDCVQILKKS
ncbi:polysaccharide pyruvyl transferase family protein [Desulfomicrobium sp. ZS1]|uniref:polysaccharide pyruvyl transferase family protein n=1 Tax=Desulfomicrobium sp. ZS1 TaxID=2952228 RepID=UPI0020B276F5|nr:polysaccharide pyruvyl transferase family protein [Desulfomicrobium sp. ZS1]UTF50098.1 polysaccharide pyruvyl transferase family protein [Desulfomicrobium sp. ZS1]